MKRNTIAALVLAGLLYWWRDADFSFALYLLGWTDVRQIYIYILLLPIVAFIFTVIVRLVSLALSRRKLPLQRGKQIAA